ncbi:2,3-bisphosphoglycerate-dependent phosphoglycerate mutase [Jatrophihabitans sp. DSM 45814]
MTSLLLLRHGETAYNVDDRFAGWVDVPLNEEGCRQARLAARQLIRSALLPDVVFTSPLIRSLLTAEVLLDEMGSSVRPTVSLQLIERHYGALQGRRRSDVYAEFGNHRTQRWRRGWDVVPPPADAGIVRSESLRDVADRLLPYWTAIVEPELKAGRCVLVVSHGNALRVIQRHLEGLTESEAALRDLPVAVPYLYDWQAGLHLVAPDPVTANWGQCGCGTRRR